MQDDGKVKTEGYEDVNDDSKDLQGARTREEEGNRNAKEENSDAISTRIIHSVKTQRVKQTQ